MISVKVTNSEIIIKGHANQNAYGNDIVCASVSTAIIMTVNQLELLEMLNGVSVVLEEGYAKINVDHGQSIVLKVFENLIYTLKELELQYPKYIKIQRK